VGYEIDFLRVGEESKSGQAIVLRFGNLFGPREQQRVMVIDGGFLETGDRIIDHVTNLYGTDYIDVVVSTHPDADHVKGLEKVLLELDVRELWMHLPWTHPAAEEKLFEAAGQVSPKIAERVAKAIEAAQTLEVVANSQNVPVVEPFGPAAEFDGQLVILGPSRPFYEQLLIEEGEQTAIKEAIYAAGRGASNLLEAATAPVTNWLDESWDVETLTDEGTVSPMNESSAVFELRNDGGRVLLTADAGQRALGQVADVIGAAGLATQPYELVHVPHHGSRRNVGPTVLNRLVGTIGERGQNTWAACACAAAKGDPKHPSKKVANAFTRRGATTWVTRTRSLWFYRNAPPRPDWSAATDPEPLYSKVEDT
jgi:beta-lactamase superfamily II metal-dependent hydrolase